MTVKVKCINCGTMVHEFTADCPNCKKPVANRDAPINQTDSPWKMKKVDHGKKFPIIPVMIIVFCGIAAGLYFVIIR